MSNTSLFGVHVRGRITPPPVLLAALGRPAFMTVRTIAHLAWAVPRPRRLGTLFHGAVPLTERRLGRSRGCGGLRLGLQGEALQQCLQPSEQPVFAVIAEGKEHVGMAGNCEADGGRGGGFWEEKSGSLVLALSKAQICIEVSGRLGSCGLLLALKGVLMVRAFRLFPTVFRAEERDTQVGTRWIGARGRLLPWPALLIGGIIEPGRPVLLVRLGIPRGTVGGEGGAHRRPPSRARRGAIITVCRWEANRSGTSAVMTT